LGFGHRVEVRTAKGTSAERERHALPLLFSHTVSSLEEYLSELQVVELDLDDEIILSQTATTNFTKAAVVLQNSSHIYARKVEYLSKLVYETMESIAGVTNKKKKKKNRTPEEEEMDAFLEYDPEMKFLPLDDVIPVDRTEDKRHINLPASKIEELQRKSSDLHRRSSLSASSFHQSRLNGSFTQVTTQPHHPMDFVAQTSLLAGDYLTVQDNGQILWPQQVQRQQWKQQQAERMARLEFDVSDAPPQLTEDERGDVAMNEEEEDVPMQHHDDDGSLGDDKEGPGFAMNASPSPQKTVSFAPDPIVNHWKTNLDLYEPVGTKRPLVVGKTLKLPSTVTDLPSETVTGSRTRKRAVRVVAPMMPTKPKQVNEFLYVRKLVQRPVKPKSTESVADNDDDDGYEGDFGGDYDNDDDDDIDVNPMESNTGMLPAVDVPNHEEKADDEDDGMTFEERCRAHLAKRSADFEKYMRKSKLAERVDAWQSRMQPLLETEAQRIPFDIYEYGLQVMERLPVQESISFAQITQQAPPHEVCRLFLASLQLAQSSNVQLQQQQDDLKVHLLDAHVERPMETYLAPSQE